MQAKQAVQATNKTPKSTQKTKTPTFLIIVLSVFVAAFGIARYYNVEPFDVVDSEIEMEAKLTTLEIIKLYGYPAKKYTIDSNGYKLALHRIPQEANGSIPVLLVHGIMCTSAIWVDNLENSLGFLLADAGYDVWMSDRRGNRYSNKHEIWSPSQAQFWNFSVDDTAKDLVNITEFILETTGAKKLFLIGHSLGTIEIYCFLSANPEYNSKIAGVMSLSSALGVIRVKGPMMLAYKFRYFLQIFFDVGGYLEVNLSSKFVRLHETIMCWLQPEKYCNILFIYAATPTERVNMTRIPIFKEHCTGGLSVNFLYHLKQYVKRKEICYFDYEFETNWDEENFQTPCYNFSSVTTPVVLFWSENDFLGDPENLKKTLQELTNVYLVYHIPDKEYTHFEVIWGKNVKSEVYDKLINVMDELNINE